MPVSNELTKPDSDGEFEELCFALYRRMWNDSSCNRVGGSGQSQFGIDIIGHDGKATVGIQCKHYNKKAFTLSTITNDIALADAANLEIGHMLFATTAANKTNLVLEVRKFSEQRRNEGKFTVSVDFWEEISGHLRIFPEVGKAYIRNFPGAPISEILETTETHLRLYQDDLEPTRQFQAQVLDNDRILADKVDALTASYNASLNRDAIPDAKGDEVDPRLVTSLDFIRDRIREGKCSDAKSMLDALGDPAQFKDSFSRFRWHTNQAAIALFEGRYEEAASSFLNVFELAPDHEKAHINKTHAFILLKDIPAAENACETGLAKFPQSAPLWALKLNVRMLQGDADPERDLPEDLKETTDILYTRAHLAERRGDNQRAIELLQQSLQEDPNSFEVQRAYLASALIWVDKDPVLAFHGQLTESQRTALQDAVARMEPIEQKIPAIQSDHISLEVNTNIASALMLLGYFDRGRAFAVASLRRQPLAEGLLRIRLNDLDQHQNLTEIHALTDHRLNELAPIVLGTLAEITANHGQVEWHATVMTAAETSGMELDKLNELKALSIHARWVAGKHTEAIKAAEDFLLIHSEQILPRILLGNMLLNLGRLDEALFQAEACNDRLIADSNSLEVLQVADLYYRLEQYQKAGVLYARLVKVLGNDEFTRKWLICLIESDQRWRAKELFDQLVTSVRELPTFVRIEANLARRAGDWSRMRDLLSNELARTPADSRVAVGYVGALHRLGSDADLRAYLSSDPSFKNAPAEDEFEFAKYQEQHGFSDLALRRLYRLFRAHPAKSQVAGYYLGQILIGKRVDALDPPLEVQPGTVVHLRTPAETRFIAIDIEDVPEAESWPELVSPYTELAKCLIGKKVGEKVNLPSLFGGGSAEIITLESIYAYAANKAHAQIAAAAVPAGPLWSVKVIKDDGELNVEPLLESAKQRKAQVELAFHNYSQHRFPLSMLAKAIGSDPVTLITEWPYKKETLFVGIGTHEERSAAEVVLNTGDQRYVLDLLTIAELVRRKAFEPAIRVLGKPLIPQTLREHLLILQQLAAGPRGSASLSESEGQLRLTETPDFYYDQQVSLLKDMLSCIDKYCELVPTFGPDEVKGIHRTLAQAVDADTLDSLYLAAERDAVLITDDGSLRLLSPEAGVRASMGVQPVLIEACARGLLSQDVYADIIIAKLHEGHDFVSVRAEDLYTLAKRTPTKVDYGVRLALESFRKPTLDIVSGVRVVSEFLRYSISKLQPTTVAIYGKLALDVLQHDRPELADEIHRAVAAALEDIQYQGRKLDARERRLFSPLLNPPKAPQIKPRLNVIAEAIQSLFKNSNKTRRK
jgi:tetratricopeptide (TPR) repeat protein